MRVLAALLMVLAGLTEEDWNRYFEGEREEMLARMPRESVARSIRILRSRPKAEVTPMLTRPISADDGVLWVGPFAFPWEPTPPLLMIDFENARFARVEVPADSRIHEIGEDYVVLSRLGEFDVTYVELYELWRGTAGP